MLAAARGVPVRTLGIGFLALVGLLAVPLQATFVPILSLFVKYGLTPDKVGFLGLWLAHRETRPAVPSVHESRTRRR